MSESIDILFTAISFFISIRSLCRASADVCTKQIRSNEIIRDCYSLFDFEFASREPYKRITQSNKLYHLYTIAHGFINCAMQFPYNNRFQNVRRTLRKIQSIEKSDIDRVTPYLLIHRHGDVSLRSIRSVESPSKIATPSLSNHSSVYHQRPLFATEAIFSDHRVREIVGGYEMYSRHRLARSDLLRSCDLSFPERAVILIVGVSHQFCIAGTH